jgi:penicillin-binding protein 1A
MSSLLQEVTRSGTAARAQSLLKRQDVYGKTGTTNDAMDAWFAGYHPNMTAVVWIGYDTPRKLGDRETGGGLSLPVWIRFMETALQSMPSTTLRVPEGLTQSGGDWAYTEFTGQAGVTTLSNTTGANNAKTNALPPVDEKRRIMDLFRQ